MKLIKLLLSTLLLSSLLLSPVVQAEVAISIENAYVRATPPTVTTSAFFAEIKNNSKEDRFIVSAHCQTAGKVELHDVIIDGDVMKMRQIKQIKIPAEQSIRLKPGSLHVMLFNLKKPLQENNTIKVTLTFANGERQTLTAPIKKVMSGMKMEHN